MKRFNVHWCDIYNTFGGCLTVQANNEHEAVVSARKILKIGCDFYLVKVYEIKA